jgi:hypothetical protein
LMNVMGGSDRQYPLTTQLLCSITGNQASSSDR